MAGPLAGEEKAPRIKPAHLMCRNRLWGVAGAAACAYFAYLAYTHIRDADFLWSHDLWSLLTYAVWTILVIALLSETLCWRERIFLGLVLLDLAIGFAFLLWSAAPLSYARDAREAVMFIWMLAAIASVLTLFRPRTQQQ